MVLQLTKCIFLFSSSPKEIPLDPINPFMHSSREKVNLYDMVRDPSKRGFGKGSPSSHIKKFCLPTNKFRVHIVK